MWRLGNMSRKRSKLLLYYLVKKKTILLISAKNATRHVDPGFEEI